jgi:hypothetical protein
MKSSAFRAGKVLAPDSKWTGEEPDWHGWETWPVEKFMKERMRMLRFYSYYLNQIDLKPFVLTYMKERGYSKADISLIRGANPNVIPLTVGKLVRAMNRGMPSLHPKAEEYFKTLPFHDEDTPPPVPKDEHDIIASDINKALSHLRKETIVADTDEVEKKPVVSPFQRMLDKVNNDIIVPLEAMMDSWCKIDDIKTKVDSISLTSFVRDGNIPAPACKFITDWINKHLEEFRGAYDKTDDQLVEGYSFLSRPALKNRINCLEAMLDEIAKVYAKKKTMRKARVKKPKDASKQVARLKYQMNSADYNIDSINPIRVPTAQTVFLFNTKYRTLAVYYATGPAGFEVKGSSLKNFNEETSFVMTLRKPKEAIDAISTQTPKKVNNFLKTLKSKKRKATGRINAQTIILRTLDTL